MRHKKKMYKCKMCRYCLFTSDMVDEHNMDQDGKTCTKSFYNFDGLTDRRNGNSRNKCQNIYLSQYPNWLVLEGSAGKILCPNKKCCSKLGNWSWIGSACACGVWQCPSFQFSPGKLDFAVDVQNV